MALVWDHFPRGGSDMLVMLALSDWCNNEGLSLHPSIRAIAEKCRLSEVQARRIVHGLIADRYLEVVGNHGGGAPGASRQYRLMLERLTSPISDKTPLADDRGTSLSGDSPTPLADDRGITVETALTHDRDGSHLSAETPLTGESQTKNVNVKNHHRSEISKSSKKRTAITLKKFLDDCRATGEKPIPETDSVFEYAERVGIPIDFLKLNWLEFRARFSEPAAKRYKDWRAAFRNSVRGNWFKLWWIGADGVCALTTVGEQAKRTHGRDAA